MELKTSIELLESYIGKENYRGYDPYDALKSPLFKLPIFRNNRLVRFGTQQFVKRSPLDLRQILFIPKGYNPVTLGLCIQAYAYLYQTDQYLKEKYYNKIENLVEELKCLVSKGFSGACWGYDFDWEARHAKILAYQPTIVATGIITNALYIANQITSLQQCSDLVISAAQFAMKDLNRTYKGDSFCFSYSPFDHQQVLNASMKGARLLSQAYALTGNETFKQEAKRVVDFVLSQQNEDGSWGYSLASGGGWIDNYHTGYVLDCLDEYRQLTQSPDVSGALQKGYHFYRSHFITKEGIPRFYHNSTFPIDCTAAAQTILILNRFEDILLAKVVAKWMSENMQAENGSFYFRKFKSYTIKTSFMRWSNAWMFMALTSLYSSLLKT